MNADYKDFKHKELTDEVTTTRIVGGLASPKRALLPAPLKGTPYNFSCKYTVNDKYCSIAFAIHTRLAGGLAQEL